MNSTTAGLQDAREYSERQISLLREDLTKVIHADSLAVVMVGSYGRREASTNSDLDYFFISTDPSYSPDKEVTEFRAAFQKRGIKLPSKDGAFDSDIELSTHMLKNIGGFEDSTQKLTRRLLFLLEGDWLFGKAIFDGVFDKLICHYVRETITEHQLCRFLLNDLIRYYRTICVDFECKTYEQSKSWGDRNIKLMFSRKLLYFSGVLVVAETVQQNWQRKRELLTQYLRVSPIDRVRAICGNQAERALEMYDSFLRQMASKDVRDMLSQTGENREKHSLEFRTFKNEGHRFTSELSRLLSALYDSTHPIHLAMKF